MFSDLSISNIKAHAAIFILRITHRHFQPGVILRIVYCFFFVHFLFLLNLFFSSGSLLLFLFLSGFFDVVERCMLCLKIRKDLAKSREKWALFFARSSLV